MWGTFLLLAVVWGCRVVSVSSQSAVNWGRWSGWGFWVSQGCSVTCGNGTETRVRSRTCFPVLLSRCPGLNEEFHNQKCTQDPCLVFQLAENDATVHVIVVVAAGTGIATTTVIIAGGMVAIIRRRRRRQRGQGPGGQGPDKKDENPEPPPPKSVPV